MNRRVVEQHEGVERELTAERAAALLRISRTLESLIAQLHARREQILQSRGESRAGERDAYDALRRDALRYRWYLEVQREALGLRQHHRLDEFYQIPAPLEP